MKIVTILGARPQFIKAGSVSREIAKPEDIQEVIVHTGQYYDTNMSDMFFDEMKIPKPDYHLDINGLNHGAMTGQMLEKIEELNRILTDRMSNVLFCPTNTAMENLINEGYDTLDIKIVKSGDIMQDGAMYYKDLAVKPKCNITDKYVLSTVHRAENTDDINRLTSILKVLNEINKDKQVILPLHPRTKKIIEKHNIEVECTIVEPVGYLEMVWLIDNCDMVITDSGGLQKEAFFFKKPCITHRDETEWVELVENKLNALVGTDKNKIVDTYKNYDFSDKFDIDLYGDGKSSENIVKELLLYE